MPRSKDESRNGAPMYDFAVLRQLRKQEGLTIQQVSDKSGISSPVISKLERNQSTAELETLYKLSRVFGMSAADLIALAEARVSQRVAATRYDSDGFTFEKIAFGNVTCHFGQARAGARISRPEIHQDDSEICWVLQGELDLEMANERYTLQTGESVQFDAIQPHTYQARADSRMVILHLRKHNRF